mgnify:CR=1 FL=1|tara:strand:+ start:2318 stop:2617 length:300 start_codon:yes stop_codon:yes gene_type:complete
MIEMLVGLHVTNEVDYAKYREGMTPILESFGGGFDYDFKISEVLKSQSSSHINRVFTIFFPDKNTMDLFFIDKDYLRFKDKFFTNAVESTTIMATYEKP